MPLADRMELSSRFRYLDGRPCSPHVYNERYRGWVIDLDHPNTLRYDPYHRLDIRFERRYGFGFLHMIYYIDFQNVYNRKNVWPELYNDTDGTKTKAYHLPFFPAGGIIIGF